ncbi:ROK family protein [Actinokineospora sp. HUAS TT18]|uniref:ROK family protein n=1 Tax=Actinokineospora sp. HUAS TT18 TaxID=3447451 RepID=UPI003F51C7BD
MQVLPGGDQSALRHLNTRRVLQLLYEGAPMTVTAVAKETDLSRPTVQGILNTLAESALLVVDGHDTPPTGGRPAQRYKFDAAAGLLAGIDIGAHAVSVRVTNLAGALVGAARKQVATDDRAARLDLAADLVRGVLPGGGRGLWAAGVGTPGILDEDGVVRLSVAIPDWTGVPLAAELAARLDCPVVAMKDAGMAVLAEHRVGAAREVSDLLYVHVGHRLGVGLLVDGKPFVGPSGAAGEIGRHPAFGWNSAPARLAADAGVPDASTDDAVESVLARAGRGDRAAIVAVDAFAKSVAAGIGAMVLAVDPRLVVLGGGMTRARETILGPVARHLADLTYEVPPLVLSTLGEDAVTIGATEAARDHVRARLFGAS